MSAQALRDHRLELESEARGICVGNGHLMHPFRAQADSPVRTVSYCRSCGRGVWVDAFPLANGPEVAGDALTVACSFQGRV
jgi:hypothetical protein